VKYGQFLALAIVIGLGGSGHEQQPRIKAEVSKLYAPFRTTSNEPW
jgi:hypothetical protein